MSLTEQQENCPYCHENNGFTNIDEAVGIMGDYWDYMWRQSFGRFLCECSPWNPQEVAHGFPDGNSMMIWQKGQQSETAILTHMWPDPKNNNNKMASNLIHPSNCPVCGRLLNEEEEG